MSKRIQLSTKTETLDSRKDSIRALTDAAWNALYVTSDLNENHDADDIAFTNQKINDAFAAISRLRDILREVDAA